MRVGNSMFSFSASFFHNSMVMEHLQKRCTMVSFCTPQREHDEEGARFIFTSLSFKKRMLCVHLKLKQRV